MVHMQKIRQHFPFYSNYDRSGVLQQFFQGDISGRSPVL
jgi:hypothetical protein